MKRKVIKTVSAVAATFFLFPTLAMGQFSPDDVLISDPTKDFVDPITGDVTPNTGEGIFVDTDFLRETINGPEWSYDRGEPYFILTKQFYDKPQLSVIQPESTALESAQ